MVSIDFGPPTNKKRWLAPLFTFVFARHCSRLHGADYEVCYHPLCWLAWRLEWLAWYR